MSSTFYGIANKLLYVNFPSKENFLRYRYDHCEIETQNNKVDVEIYMDRLFRELKDEISKKINPDKDDQIKNYFVRALSNAKCREIIRDYFENKTKNTDYKMIVKELDNIMLQEEVQSLVPSSDSGQIKNEQTSKPIKAFLIGKSDADQLTRKSESEENLQMQPTSPKLKEENHRTIDERTYQIAFEILRSYIENDPKSYEENSSSKQRLKIQINNKISKDYEGNNWMSGFSIKRIIDQQKKSEKRNKIGQIRRQLKQIIDNPNSFSNSEIPKKAKKILEEVYTSFYPDQFQE